MTKYLYKKSGGRQIRFGGIAGVAVTSGVDRASGDVAILTVRGAHGGVLDRVSDRFYVVIEGTGRFSIAGTEFPVEVDDVVVIPPNTAYDFSGEMKVVIFCSPPFNPENDVAVEL